jgi:hypothetical protein
MEQDLKYKKRQKAVDASVHGVEGMISIDRCACFAINLMSLSCTSD